LLIGHATQSGANAVLGFRYDASEVVANESATEVLCYGTAVVLERDAHRNQATNPSRSVTVTKSKQDGRATVQTVTQVQLEQATRVKMWNPARLHNREVGDGPQVTFNAAR